MGWLEGKPTNTEKVREINRFNTIIKSFEERIIYYKKRKEALFNKLFE